jgi:hypothetical protein
MKNHEEQKKESFIPLVVIILLILVTVVATGVSDFSHGHFMWESIMQRFMAGFFLIFSGFKLIDLKGFVQGYSHYDIIAQKLKVYGYVYPFLELSIGILYLIGNTSPYLHIFTALLMTIGGIGVVKKIAKKEKFTCACLGTFLNVPLTKITVVENFGMAIMALLMLLM